MGIICPDATYIYLREVSRAACKDEFGRPNPRSHGCRFLEISLYSRMYGAMESSIQLFFFFYKSCTSAHSCPFFVVSIFYACMVVSLKAAYNASFFCHELHLGCEMENVLVVEIRICRGCLRTTLRSRVGRAVLLVHTGCTLKIVEIALGCDLSARFLESGKGG